MSHTPTFQEQMLAHEQRIVTLEISNRRLKTSLRYRRLAYRRNIRVNTIIWLCNGATLALVSFALILALREYLP